MKTYLLDGSKAVFGVLALVAMLLGMMAGWPRQIAGALPMPADNSLQMQLSNVRDTTFAVSWLTDQPVSGEIRYGVDPNRLDQRAFDDRGDSIQDDTHYVTVRNLAPGASYYFDIVSGGVTDNNQGAHYLATTGPILAPPFVDTIYGQVMQEDGVTPAEGCIAYIILRDANSAGSSGQAAQLSSLTDESGYWFTNLGEARTAGLGGYFSYSASGDELLLDVQCAGAGSSSQVVNTDNDSPAPTIVLKSGTSPTSTSTQTPTMSPTATASPTPTATRTATTTASPSPTATRTPSPTPSPQPTSTSTATPTSTRTATATSSPSPTSTKTPTFTATPTKTLEPSPTPTNTPGATPTATATSSPPECRRYDFNNDHVIDIVDVSLVASRWQNDLLYDVLYDVAPTSGPDGVIDITDIGVVAFRFGWLCP